MNDSYTALSGKTLALVENTPSAPAYHAALRARESGLTLRLLTRDPSAYTETQGFAGLPLDDVEVVLVETNDPSELVSVLTGADGSPLVDGVTSFSDYYCGIAAQVASSLILPGPRPAAVEAGIQKHRLRELLSARPYAVKHALVSSADQLTDAAALLGFPLVAKPPAEGNSVGVRLIADQIELAAAFEELHAVRANWRGQPCSGDVLLEEYLLGEEVSVETMTFAGRTHLYGITSKSLNQPPNFVEWAHSFPHRLNPDDATAVEAVVRDMLETVGFDHGPCHTEVKLTSRGPRIVEMNPRLPGNHTTSMIEDVGGTNPFLDSMLCAIGEVPPIPVLDHGGAAIAILYPLDAGVVESIDGVEEARSAPGVRFVHLYAGAGDLAHAPVNNYSSLGCVYAWGEDAADALVNAESGLSKITVRVRGGRAGAR
jgi:biotin carboxylase